MENTYASVDESLIHGRDYLSVKTSIGENCRINALTKHRTKNQIRTNLHPTLISFFFFFFPNQIETLLLIWSSTHQLKENNNQSYYLHKVIVIIKTYNYLIKRSSGMLSKAGLQEQTPKSRLQIFPPLNFITPSNCSNVVLSSFSSLLLLNIFFNSS